MTINSICVCGAGTMGSGIAQVSAQAGYFTLLYELNATVLDKARTNINANLDKAVDLGKLTAQDKEATLQRIRFTSDLQECLADMFIEAIVENVAVKVALFNQLAELNHSECIFATNTSSLSVSSIAAGIQNPGRVAGMHFFNPAFLMKLVEVVKAAQTADGVVEIIRNVAISMGKVPVICQDAPGFIVNHVARPFYIEALRMAEQGIPFGQIDRLLEAAGFKMGPFRLMDLIGNDINFAVSQSVFDQMGEPERLKPSFIQKEKVETGELGRKTGKGYYGYGRRSD